MTSSSNAIYDAVVRVGRAAVVASAALASLTCFLLFGVLPFGNAIMPDDIAGRLIHNERLKSIRGPAVEDSRKISFALKT